MDDFALLCCVACPTGLCSLCSPLCTVFLTIYVFFFCIISSHPSYKSLMSDYCCQCGLFTSVLWSYNWCALGPHYPSPFPSHCGPFCSPRWRPFGVLGGSSPLQLRDSGMRNRFELLKKKKNSLENPKLCIKYQEKSLSEKKTKKLSISTTTASTRYN